jgi:hypothetical protein
VGDHGHLHWTCGHWEPNHVDRDTRVEVQRFNNQVDPTPESRDNAGDASAT